MQIYCVDAPTSTKAFWAATVCSCRSQLTGAHLPIALLQTGAGPSWGPGGALVMNIAHNIILFPVLGTSKQAAC